VPLSLSTENQCRFCAYSNDSALGTYIVVLVPAGATTGSFHVLVNDTGMSSSTLTVTP